MSGNVTNNNTNYMGMKYIFGYYNSEDKCWRIQPRKFILLKDESSKELIGQFLQSLWYNKEYDINDKIHFVVLSVNNLKSNIDIEKDMNKIKNPFPTLHDIPYYCFSAYYVLSYTIIQNCLFEFKFKDSIEFTLKSVNNSMQTLTIKIYKHDKYPKHKIIISQPQFIHTLT